MDEEEYRQMVRWSLYGILSFLVMLMAIALTSCWQIRYVPVETVRTDSIAIHDTAWQIELVPYHDSVATHDTASYLCNPYAYSYAAYNRGTLRHSLGIWENRPVTVRVPYFIDRYVRIREPKIVEVEKKLTRWQRVYMDAGKIALYGVIPFAMVIVGWMVKKRIG